MSDVRKWVIDDSWTKRKLRYTTKDWSINNGICPRQLDGYNCGVLTLLCARYICGRALLSYSNDAATMREWRNRIGCAILRGNI